MNEPICHKHGGPLTKVEVPEYPGKTQEVCIECRKETAEKLSVLEADPFPLIQRRHAMSSALNPPRGLAPNTSVYSYDTAKCDECGFQWHRNPVDSIIGEPCPNQRSAIKCPGEMQRMTWESIAKENQEFALNILDHGRKLLKALDDLMDDSRGVGGLHLNGDIATWDELCAGGRFEEWLGVIEDFRSVVGNEPRKEGER